MFDQILSFIKELYPNQSFIGLHQPVFLGNEKMYLNECIDTTFVSTVGPFVERFEKAFAAYTGAASAVTTVNGTAALHAALLLVGVKPGDEVITQDLTFIATANAIAYCGAKPAILDIDRINLGLSPSALNEFLTQACEKNSKGEVINRKTGRRVAACVPMHVFGHSVAIEEIAEICSKWGIPLVEDAAEALGSFHRGKHLGRFGRVGIFSFNGNKTLTTGGGGMIVTDDVELGRRAKHLTTTARLPHKWEFIHDEVGYNYRMPNLNAALGCAQLEYLEKMIENKRETFARYKKFFAELKIPFLEEAAGDRCNYWLNAIFLKDKEERDAFLAKANEAGVMVRPAWALVSEAPMFKDSYKGDNSVACDVRAKLVNLPSGYRETA